MTILAISGIFVNSLAICALFLPVLTVFDVFGLWPENITTDGSGPQDTTKPRRSRGGAPRTLTNKDLPAGRALPLEVRAFLLTDMRVPDPACLSTIHRASRGRLWRPHRLLAKNVSTDGFGAKHTPSCALCAQRCTHAPSQKHQNPLKHGS